MAKHLRVIAFFSFFAAFITTNAQNISFSKDGAEGYLANLETAFSVAADRRAARDFINEVSLFWNSPETTDELKKLMVEVSEKMQEKRARPYPEFHTYLTTILSFNKSGHPAASFNAWHTGILTLLSDSRYPLRHAIRLYELTTGLLDNKTIYSTAALQWDISADRFNFLFTDSLFVSVDNTNLICKTRNDSITVINTGGVMNLMSGHWKGNRGTINWEQSGFAPGMVFASFDNYSADLSRNELKIDSVEFYNKHYFNYSLKGHLHHRLMNIRNPENTTYPKFESYEQRYHIDNIYENFKYEGGFSQHGAKFLGSGTPHNPAVISIYRNDTLFITAKSLYFALRKDQIISTTTEITIHLDTGYIYHPGLHFKYMQPVKEVHFIRDGEGISRSPFFNTYHNISMDTELIKWKTTDPFMELRMITGASENHAFFESISYYRDEFFNQIQGMDGIHPLQGLLNCQRMFKNRPFTAKDYASFLRMPESQVRQQIIGLSFHGFIGYNVNTDTIEIRERLTDFLQFRTGQKDYDVIRFKSLTPGQVPNAIFDLKNYDLAMNGVSAISISDRQNVVFFPENEKILMKKDRNFNFSGSITAGMVNLFGNEFVFNYKEFRIDLNIIDSLSLRIETDRLDYYGRPAQQRIRNTISQLSGYLEIDRNDNKSGKEEYPEFPRLTSTTNSYVYYNHPSTQKGVYNKETFYFLLDPFEIDSINRLSNKNIAFSGDFNSSIFPVIEETLVVRPDYSLGFRRRSPEEGYPIYGNKALYKNFLDLSNNGLLGNGSLEYITSSSSSEEFTFLPDKTHGLAHRFNITASETGVEFPDVQGSFASIDYLPFEEKLTAQVKEEPFTMFNKEANIDGSLTITPNGLEGSGIFNMAKANLTAKQFTFGHHVAMADASDFNLVNSDNPQDVNFKTTNLLSNINFKTRQGTFSSRDAGSKVEFTENRYIAYISEFSWDMDNNDIYLGTRGSAGNRFVSTHRRQDSLDFIVPIALYDVENRTIKAEEVKSIKVADTEMILNDGKVTIKRDAVLDSLLNVRIVLNDSLHQFYESNVHIAGKFDYNAAGRYDYINGSNDVKTITFHKIGVDRERKTIAEATITPRELFTFNRRFAFRGNTTLSSGKPLLHFNGGTQMLHDCSILGPQHHVRFNAEIDPNNVMIPIGDNVQNYEFENIYRHFYLNRDSNVLYSSFLEGRRFHSDVPVLSAKGLLVFNDSLNSFMLAEQHRIAVPDTTGNVMLFHNNGCAVTGFGNISMGLELEQVKTFTAGEISHNRSEDKARMVTLFGVDFMLDPLSIDIMTNAIRNADHDLKGSPESPSTIRRMAEWLNRENALKVSRELQGIDKMKSVAAQHQHMIVLDSLSWFWDSASRSYRADGDATLLWIKDNPINRKVSVKAVIAFSRGGNSFDLLIDASNDIHFFFSYRNSMMQTRSSVAEYNTNVQTLKQDDRRLKTRIGERGYTFILAPESRLRRLLNIFKGEDMDADEVYEDDGTEVTEEEEI
jgi:hypothetical protein